MKLWIVVLIVIIIFMYLFIWSLCRISASADRHIELMHQNKEWKDRIMSNSENEKEDSKEFSEPVNIKVSSVNENISMFPFSMIGLGEQVVLAFAVPPELWDFDRFGDPEYFITQK